MRIRSYGYEVLMAAVSVALMSSAAVAAPHWGHSANRSSSFARAMPSARSSGNAFVHSRFTARSSAPHWPTAFFNHQPAMGRSGGSYGEHAAPASGGRGTFSRARPGTPYQGAAGRARSGQKPTSGERAGATNLPFWLRTPSRSAGRGVASGAARGRYGEQPMHRGQSSITSTHRGLGLLTRAAPTPKARIERSIAPWTRSMTGRIREQNNRAARAGLNVPREKFTARPGGNNVPARVFRRSTDPVVSSTYQALRSHFGTPEHGYRFVPRSTGQFSMAYRTGRGGEFGGFFHYGATLGRHDREIFLSFYYPYYFDDPFFTGFWYAGYYPSIYYYYGWVPRWCYPPSLVVYDADPYPIYLGMAPYYYLQQPPLDVQGVGDALADIRAAWLDDDIDQLAYHLRQNQKISVYFDTKYTYSLSPDDFYEMTLDAMSTMKTRDVKFDSPIWINSSEVFVTGRHIFRDMNNKRETVYISYRLHLYGGRWYIIGVGSSPKPIEPQYHDFRYSS